VLRVHVYNHCTASVANLSELARSSYRAGDKVYIYNIFIIDAHRIDL
jgi:hypothetical protein